MQNPMSRAILALPLALATLSPVAAQEWPNRTITLVVPFAPGGGVDISARLQAQAIGDILGQNVIVENIGGGAGAVAAVSALWAVEGRLRRFGAGGLAELAEPGPFLGELARRGVRTAVFQGDAAPVA